MQEVPEQDKYDNRWLKAARFFAHNWSKDPSTKVGAVIVNWEQRMVSFGYNGFPIGIEDKPELLADREEKLKRTIHAEVNAILNATAKVEGCTLYTYPFPPCYSCALPIIQSGIIRVVSPMTFRTDWIENMAFAKSLFAEAYVDVLYRNIEE